MPKRLFKTDIENRFPAHTVTEASVGSITTFTLKDAGSVIIARASSNKPLAAVIKLRRQLLNGEDAAFLLTTAQRDALSNPIEGTVIFNTTTKVFNVFESSIWVAV